MVALPTSAVRLLVLICAYTSFITFKPSEPFLVAFLQCEKNITRSAIIHDVFPVWSYAYLALLPVLCAAAELIGCKIVVLMGAACRLVTVMLLLWPITDGSVMTMQVSQVTIAAGFAAHPALSAIMYRGLPRAAYAQGAGYVAAFGVVSSVVASLLGQQLLVWGHVELTWLFVLSAIFTAAGLFFALLLPLGQSPPSKSEGLLPRANGGADAPSSCESACRPINGAADARVDAGADPSGSAAMPADDAQSSAPPVEAGLLLSDTLRTLRHSGAVYYYAWLSVATAVHHLVVTYWQAFRIETHHHHHPPPPPPANWGGIGNDAALYAALPSSLGAEAWSHHSSTPAPLLPTDSMVMAHVMGPASPSIMMLAPLDLDATKNISSCVHPAGESANGYTQAVASLLGGCAALLPMLGERCLRGGGTYARLRDGLLLNGPLALAALLYMMSVVESEVPYMAGYVLFHVCFELLRVICEAEGARCIANYRASGKPRFAAVSGLTTTLCLTLQVLLQVAFNHPHRLELQTQFQILSAILLALFLSYAGLALCRCALRGSGAPNQPSPLPSPSPSPSASPEAERRDYQCFSNNGGGTATTVAVSHTRS